MSEIIVKIEKYDNTGQGIAFYNNKIMFIPNTYVGDILKVEIISETKKIIKIKVIDIVEKSNIRTNSFCEYKNCGGCNYLNISYENELKIKKECFEKLFNIENVNIVKSKNYLEYRNKIILHFDKKIGLYEKESNKIINIKKCMLVKNDINLIIQDLNNIKFNNIEKIIIKSGLENIVIIYSKNKIIEDLSNVNADNIVNIYNDKINIIKGKNYIQYKINEYIFKSTLDSFFQTNEYQISNIINLIINSNVLNINSRLLELYCGNGSLGIQLSKYVKKVFGIEINNNSIEDAKYNIKINNIKNADYICADLNTFENISNNFDIVLLDPPRNGISKNIMKYLLKNNFKNIIYISCNPFTLKNDITFLSEKYSVDNITLVDMFPRTNHVESVVILEKTK